MFSVLIFYLVIAYSVLLNQTIQFSTINLRFLSYSRTGFYLFVHLNLFSKEFTISASLQLQQQKKSKQKMPPLTKLTLFIHDYGLWDACAKE